MTTHANHKGNRPMSRQIFVNLPVRDLPRSKAFFAALREAADGAAVQ